MLVNFIPQLLSSYFIFGSQLHVGAPTFAQGCWSAAGVCLSEGVEPYLFTSLITILFTAMEDFNRISFKCKRNPKPTHLYF